MPDSTLTEADWVERLMNFDNLFSKSTDNKLISAAANKDGNPQNEWYYDEISGFY